jgi:hypothetical protein
MTVAGNPARHFSVTPDENISLFLITENLTVHLLIS